MADQTRKPSTPVRDITEGMLEPRTFYVRKKNVRPMLHALTGTQPNNYQPQGAPGLQDRTDLSGKFARRLAGIRRALTAADAQVIEERKDLTFRHASKFPEFEKDGVTPHPKAGQPTPVYAINPQDGSPVFKKDHAGNDTEERIVLADNYNLADQQAFEKEFKALLDEFIVVQCVGFTDDDFNAFKPAPGQNSPIGKIVDALSDLIRDGETEATPAEQAAALQLRAASLCAEADRILEDIAGGSAVDTGAHAEVEQPVDNDAMPEPTAP